MTEKTVSSEVVYTGRAVKLRVDTVETSDGQSTTREIIEHADCIAVVAVDADGNILLVRQFRKSIESDLSEIPAGGIDPGESPEAAVDREMREETGFQPRKIERLGGFYSAPGYCTEYLYLFLASDLVLNPLTAEDTEGITLVPVSADRIPGMIASGEIRDSKSIAGLMAYLHVYQKSG